MAYIFLLESNYLSIDPQTRKYSLFYVTVSRASEATFCGTPLTLAPETGKGKNPSLSRKKP